jgi:hypothetical protein
VAAHEDVLRDVEVSEELRLLVDDRDAAIASVARPVEVRLFAGDEHGALVRPVNPADDPYERALAGAVLPDQGVDLAGGQSQMGAAQSVDTAERLADVAQLDRGGRGGRHATAMTPSAACATDMLDSFGPRAVTLAPART